MKKLKSMRLQVTKFTRGGLAMVALGLGVSTGSLALAAPTPAAGLATATANAVTPVRPITPAAQPVAAAQPAASEIRVQVVAETSATIGAPMSGRLSQFALRDGDRFRQGQVIARFVCAEKEGALAHARAVFDGRQIVNASKQRLHALGSTSDVEYKVAEADEEQAAADVKTAQTLVDTCVVAAPFTGRVSAVFAHNFQFLQTGAPLLDVLSDRNLDLEMIVPSMWLAWLKPGNTFNVAIDETGKTYPATLTRLSGKVDAVSRSIKVYGHIDNPPDTLLPGMSGRAVFTPPAGTAVSARQ
ncbi:efflux RND transporter periplasmic adaptor subunit [Paraburkholderia dipogonis]|uniref:Efflux RND transporter periplasmic adaptor subunit n=1 Tax=Paraburkholderia dipogonis TaxID=1211383 RepID=A0ABW9AQJ1_9BURK